MNKKMVYTPQEIACKTVIVTEPYVCPTPTIMFPDTPDISFVGTNGECRIRIDVGTGNTIAGLATNESFIRVDTGNGWVYMNEYVNPSASLQTVDLAWEMDTTVEYTTRIEANIVSSCDAATSGLVYSDWITYYPPGVADIVATSVTAEPTSCNAPCDVTIMIEWQNIGTTTGSFRRGYTINGALTEESYTIDMVPGAIAQRQFYVTFGTPGNYEICPVLRPGDMICPIVTVSEPGVADIVATEIVVTPSTCEAPCGISIGITWRNVGGAAGSFYPGYDLNGVPVSESSEVILSQGATLQRVYTDTLPDAGSYVICPLPN
jgi:hypothetical protein